ncbi:hypothetical protein HYPSUDRAFT_150744 [Hypholoma sublateritium FD-334 SS-4]|uniref:SnoaL-like domain-containing protein n=1 Tax=Hypholoma sublateritium (strain FD-334 SS-4) TaxID=945553 RepID=A0A0D2N4S3_HYPSF|nr:hypothetical protein HYPSUDRAFT_150744 [Hypholoma sublateritium FD-334 SS-4]
MHPFFALISALALALVASATSSYEGFPPAVCNNRTTGPNLEVKQQAALADFAHLYIDLHDIQTAYDRWVPGEYIQHNPNAPQGREAAIQILSAGFANPEVTSTNATVFGGQGFGAIHFKLTVSPTTSFAVVDYFRFQGTCIVEHWDVLQQIFGNETNPIAFF